MILNPYRYAAASATPTLDTATEWWTAGALSGTTMLGQKGVDDFTADQGSPTATTHDGYNVIHAGFSDNLALSSTTLGDVGAGEDFTAVMCFQLVAGGSTRILFSKRVGGDGQSWLVYHTSSNVLTAGIENGGPVDSETNGALTTATWYTVGVRRSGSTVYAVRNGTTPSGTTGATTGSLANSRTAHLSSYSDNSLISDIRIAGVAFFIGTALTDAEVDDVHSELLAEAAV